MSNLSAIPQAYDREQTRSSLLALVDDVRDTLTECADAAEQDGFYPERGWRALHESGLFRMKAPLELGGFEVDPMTQLEVLEEVARIDTAAGWTLFVGAGTLGLASAWLPDEALESFMTDGRLPRTAGAAAPSGRATPVDGGYRVTGRWAFASGSAHAESLSGGGMIEGAEPRPGLVFVFEPQDVTFHDNWNVNGLRGTGSQDISVENVFVPTEMSFNFLGPAARGGAAYRMGPLGYVVVEHAAFALGVARRAIDEAAELAKTKIRGGGRGPTVADRGKFQYDLGLAQTRLEAARDHVLAVYEEIWQVAHTGPVGPELQIKVRCAAVYATEVGLDVCRSMFRYAGARSLFRGNVIERCLRDMQAGAQHIMVNDGAYEVAGQLAMGLPDINPFG